MDIASRSCTVLVVTVLSSAVRSSSSCENISLTLRDWAKARTVASTPEDSSFGLPTLYLCFPDLIRFRMILIRSVGDSVGLWLCLLLSSIAEETGVSKPCAGLVLNPQTSAELSSDGDA